MVHSLDQSLETHTGAGGRVSSAGLQSIKSAALLWADLIAFVLAGALAWMITGLWRAGVDYPALSANPAGISLHLGMAGAFSLALLAWFRSRGHYHRREALADQMPAILIGCAAALMAAGAIQFATIEVGSRLLTMLHWVLLAPVLVITRLAARTSLRSAGLWTSPAIVFCEPARAASTGDVIARHDALGVHVETAVSTQGLASRRLIDMMRQAAASGLVVVYAPSPGERHQHAVIRALTLEGVPFLLAPQLGPLPAHAEILNYPLEDVSFVDVRDPLARPLARAAKRAFDIAASAALLIVLAPVMGAVALAVRADGGPALFRQKRAGSGGEVFDCLKFRSMQMDAEARLEALIASDPAVAAEWNAFQKLRRDPRITAVGRLIRKTNIDELPQLINVLRGEMSLVGPRPMTLGQMDEYGDYLTAYQRVRPGLTGLWQTNGRNATTFAERARLDAWYVRNWSLWRDFVILIRTVREVVFARGG
ncbi:exopolysaccharide biosynthesis polyprenyl glycosylphosphotransferase [Alkalicaulis satelles]|uniref:Exopolysaccharide biosynthesis polyprenyl glycosylphosphotransferase n=1 Tax=Alkalicaulis satelles TaxID=2609175 RepID=A0A5M6ZRZ2_9PROT|nr:exopolysaccharide biosynthesis polyprenyl glycosylphosphotransferase [Alkalicaulis satelles]KAA5805061.1 exopolysaccharide biosynthesis polyprenyl glycosylphosphotransferase [Alkalicaulis satelles]